MNKFSTLFIVLLISCGCGSLFFSCSEWELPDRKTKRDCVIPAGNLDAQAQLLKVDFSIGSGSGTIDKVTWNFGNNSTTVTTGTTASYTYTAPGSYTVTATLTNTCDQTAILQRIISVSNVVLPTVSLQPVTDYSSTSVTLRMLITSNGNQAITRYGICYSTTNAIPDISKDLVVYKDGAGSLNTPVSFTLTSLPSNTTYYARSFAINEKGIGYSDPALTFRTGLDPVVVSNGVVTAFNTTATVDFVLANPGNPGASAYGVCYSSTNPMPNIYDSQTQTVPVNSPVANSHIAVTLPNLTPNKTYYYCCYAIPQSGPPVYDVVRSFATQTEAVTQDLIASISFTDGSKQDASGYNNHVTLVNNPTFITDRKGRVNSAILLDGIDDYFYIPESSSLNPDAISISIWIKPSAVSSTMQIYNKSNFSDASAEMYSSLIKPSNSSSGVTINTDIKQQSNCERGKGWQTFTFTSSPDLSKWHHIVMVYSGKSARMYFDNVVLATTDDLPATTIDKCPGGDLKFGAQSSDLPNYFYGALDDIRIYKRALTAAEIQILYNQ